MIDRFGWWGTLRNIARLWLLRLARAMQEKHVGFAEPAGWELYGKSFSVLWRTPRTGESLRSAGCSDGHKWTLEACDAEGITRERVRQVAGCEDRRSQCHMILKPLWDAMGT